jgi:hypothetical protein
MPQSVAAALTEAMITNRRWRSRAAVASKPKRSAPAAVSICVHSSPGPSDPDTIRRCPRRHSITGMSYRARNPLSTDCTPRPSVSAPAVATNASLAADAAVRRERRIDSRASATESSRRISRTKMRVARNPTRMPRKSRTSRRKPILVSAGAARDTIAKV